MIHRSSGMGISPVFTQIVRFLVSRISFATCFGFAAMQLGALGQFNGSVENETPFSLAVGTLRQALTEMKIRSATALNMFILPLSGLKGLGGEADRALRRCFQAAMPKLQGLLPVDLPSMSDSCLEMFWLPKNRKRQK